MDGERIARRSVAFFLIKSGVNFLAVAVLGAVMALGLLGPDLSLWLTAFPAAVATLALVRGGGDPAARPRPPPGPERPRLRRWVAATRTAVIDGTAEALQILRSGNRRVLAGSFGYWVFDNAVLWATFHAFGLSPPLTVVLMGYLIGQLGGLLPIPGGIGGIDGGLIGTLIVYGAPAAGTAAAVLAYRRDPLLAAADRRRHRVRRAAPRHAQRLRVGLLRAGDRRPVRLTSIEDERLVDPAYRGQIDTSRIREGWSIRPRRAPAAPRASLRPSTSSATCASQPARSSSGIAATKLIDAT